MKITVIGGANIDITGRSKNALRKYDSNPSQVHISGGGVGRNIAENLSRLGAEVSFISAVGDDRFAPILRGFIAEAGLDGSRLIARKNMNTGLYLVLLEPTGELFVAVNDMEAVESITPADIECLSETIAESDLIVVDANLRPDTLKAVSQTAAGAASRTAGGVPLMADTVSAGKAARLMEILPRLELLKTNRAEAEVLTGFPLDTEAALREGCGRLLGLGLRQLYITLGAQGACCASKDGVYFQNTLPAELVNVNGAGDAFAAGAAFSYCRGNATDSVAANGIFASACAAITLECDDGVCKTLTREAAEKRAGLLK